MVVKKISASEFRKINIPILFEDDEIDRTFGVLSNGKYKYKLGWQSENIKPIVTKLSNSIYSIGIDLKFVLFEIESGKILKDLILDYYFYKTEIYHSMLFVITQLEIIKLNSTDFLILEKYQLPNFFENLEFNEEFITIKCIDGQTIDIR